MAASGNRNRTLIIAITASAGCALACLAALCVVLLAATQRSRILGALGFGETQSPAAPAGAPTPPGLVVPTSPPRVVPTPSAILQDDFSDPNSGWSVESGDFGSKGYENGEFVVRSSKAKWWIVSTRGVNISNVHIEVTASDIGPATNASFGIMCGYQDIDNQYYLGIGSDTYYAIGKFVSGEFTILSSPDNEWAASDRIRPNAGTYRLAADCGPGQLALYVDGQMIASASDSTFSSGDVALFVLTWDQPNAEIHFDDFVATQQR
ncbi:MAG: hypothetical protein HY260_12975 [Chloroflexi bacterium]|nr:hypothetical protein [Chloroflexota bacterium]